MKLELTGAVPANKCSSVMRSHPAIDYEPTRLQPATFWRRNVLLWAIVCFNGYCFAIIGPLFVIVGIRSFFADPAGSLWMFGEPVRTTLQKAVWMTANLAIGTIGVWFVAWHRSSKRSGKRV